MIGSTIFRPASVARTRVNASPVRHSRIQAASLSVKGGHRIGVAWPNKIYHIVPSTIGGVKTLAESQVRNRWWLGGEIKAYVFEATSHTYVDVKQSGVHFKLLLRHSRNCALICDLISVSLVVLSTSGHYVNVCLSLIAVSFIYFRLITLRDLYSPVLFVNVY